MGLFGNLSADGLEEKEDRVGGGSFAFDTDVYLATIKLPFAGKSNGGADFVDITFEIDGKEYSERFWVTSSAAKGNKNFYMVKDKDKKETGKKKALPGFDIVNDICLLTLDLELREIEFEEKVVQIWDTDAGKKVPKNAPVATGLIGQQVYIAIQKKIENKSTKNQTTGEYDLTADTREVNSVEKVGHYPSKTTVVEAQKELPVEFLDKWQEKNKGNTFDARKLKDGEAGSTSRPGGSRAGAPPASGETTGAKRSSLFGNKDKG